MGNLGMSHAESRERNAALVVSVDKLRAKGSTAEEACKAVGIHYANYIHNKNKIKKASTPTDRAIKSAPSVPFNKSLAARNASLEKMVIELSLDRQALIEELGRVRR